MLDQNYSSGSDSSYITKSSANISVSAFTTKPLVHLLHMSNSTTVKSSRGQFARLISVPTPRPGRNRLIEVQKPQLATRLALAA